MPAELPALIWCITSMPKAAPPATASTPNTPVTAATGAPTVTASTAAPPTTTAPTAPTAAPLRKQPTTLFVLFAASAESSFYEEDDTFIEEVDCQATWHERIRRLPLASKRHGTYHYRLNQQDQ